MRNQLNWTSLWFFSLCSLCLCGSFSSAAEVPSFRRDVAPVLAQRCVACHGSSKARGRFRLDTFDGLMKAEASKLVERVTAAEGDGRMPPGDDPLSPAEVDALRQWVAAGAAFDGPDRAAPLKTYLPPRAHPAAPERYPAPAPVLALAFSPDGKELFVGGLHEVTVWDSATGRLVRRLPHLPQRIHA